MSKTNEQSGQMLASAQGALQGGRFGDALELAETLLGKSPDDPDALYIAAVASRYAEEFDKARGFLLRLHAASPEFGRAWQEEGHLARAQGKVEMALSAYARAVRFNPALEAAWRAQVELFANTGRPAQAAQAQAQVKRLADLPRELIAVTNHLHESRLLRAEEICRHFLRANPKHVEAMRLLAEIGMRLGVLDDAEFLLESASAFEPGNIQVRLDYIEALRRRQNFAASREQAEQLYMQDPASPLFQSNLAIESMQTGDYPRAFELFEAVLDKLPNDAATLTSMGHALKTTGQHDEAVEAYRRAFTAMPNHGDAYYALANLKTYQFTEDEIAAMRERVERPDLAFMDSVHMSFALGKAHEDRHEFEQSFYFYEMGNRLKRRQTRYDADKMTAELRLQAEHCGAELFAQKAGMGHDAPDPVFIVGLPRAGSTLLEQILASHSQIDGTLELPNILAFAHKLRGRRAGQTLYPQVLNDLGAEQLSQMGRDYIDGTSIHRKGAPFFIDKMPNNFRHIALIHLILPSAKIIDARREPMDCCFSGFKQLFAEGQEFTYGQREVGQYYRDYVNLMDHWDAVLPGRILRVQHEDVLDDLEGQVRRMLGYLDLPFEQQCLDFHRTERAVRTASSEQVRQPINRSGQGSWKPYDPWLKPLREALGPLV
ncbi:MAG: sulfotransferase [Sphingomonadaceae bacterium]|nr:sulfotransferase [Sphingomonadaceae bacterium]